MYLARVLGAEGFGQYSWAMAVYSYLYLFGNFGFDIIGIRKLAVENNSAIISGVMVLRGMYVVLLVVLVYLLNVVVFKEPNYLLLLQSASILLLPFNVQYIFRGLGRGKYDGVYRGTQAGLFLVLVYLTIQPDGILTVPMLWFASSAIVSVAAFFFVRKIIPFRFSFPTFETIKTIFRESVPVGVAGALILIYLNFDTIVLGMYVSGYSLGLYSVAFKIYYFGYTILGLLYVAFLPSLSRYTSAEFSSIRSSYTSLLLMLAVVLATVGTALSTFIIQILFGEGYSESIPVLRVLLLSLSAACINSAYLNPLQAVGKDALFIKLLLGRTLLFAIVCMVLIPSYGITGAAFATLVAEVCTVGGSVVVYYRVFPKHNV